MKSTSANKYKVTQCIQIDQERLPTLLDSTRHCNATSQKLSWDPQRQRQHHIVEAAQKNINDATPTRRRRRDATPTDLTLTKDAQTNFKVATDTNLVRPHSVPTSTIKTFVAQYQQLNCTRPSTTGTSKASPLFRTLGDGEKIEDLFSFGTTIFDGGHKDKVLNAKRKTIQAGEIADCVLKVQTKRRLKRDIPTWRSVMQLLFSAKVSPHVLKVHEIVEDKQAFYIVMEKCTGGELFHFLANEEEIPVAECKRLIREILLGLHELHSKGLIHGDVKPENIMFADKVNRTLKLIDFDTCRQWDPEVKPTRFNGSPGYVAPETFVGKASPQSDLWSVGVILYILMTGLMPYEQEIKDTVVDGSHAKALYNDLKEESVDWNEAPWPEFPVAADLCRQLLAFDPADRMQSATDALRHPWFQERRLK